MLSDDENWCYGVADLTLMSHDRKTVMQMIRKSVRDAEKASRAAIYEAEANQILRPLREENKQLRTILANKLGAFLAPKHTGSRISAEGILGHIRDGRYYKELNFGCGTMLSHMQEMAIRFYSGDVKAVDEFLQLYDLDEKRP